MELQITTICHSKPQILAKWSPEKFSAETVVPTHQHSAVMQCVSKLFCKKHLLSPSQAICWLQSTETAETDQ